ncbi:hypothetical protein QBC32DRAFT_203832, partial [Pseudoneurospora amorphoporcata]
LLLWSGGPYALLLQISHPSVALGSCRHSRFATSSKSSSELSSKCSSSNLEVTLSRLRRTTAYILAVAIGTPEQKTVIVEMVRKQHAFVRGTGKTVEGNEQIKYDAADGELQKWVAATLFMGVCKAKESFGWSCKAKEERWKLCKAHREYAIALNMPSEMWPRSMEEFDVYVEETMQERLVVTEEARKLARILLRDVAVPWWMSWVLPLARVFMACWLPSGLREGYGLPDPKGWWVSGCYAVLVWAVALVDLVTPRVVNDAAFELMRRGMEKAVEGIQMMGRWTI